MKTEHYFKVKVFDGYEWYYHVDIQGEELEYDTEDVSVIYIDGKRIEFDNDIEEVQGYNLVIK